MTLPEAMAQACPLGHRLRFSRVSPGERGCDVCGQEIKSTYAFHCELCDYDLCSACHFPVEADREAERAQVLAKLTGICSEQDRLREAAEEEATSDALELHDAQLLQLKLQAALQRYKEKPPQLEDLAVRHEDELHSLVAEVQQLREENLKLALASSRNCGGSSGSNSNATCDSEEVCRLWQRRAQTAKLRRQAQINEFRLGQLRAEMQATAKQLRGRERQLADMRKRYAEVSDLAKEIVAEAGSCCEDVEKERCVVQDLHCEALNMREACSLPAELKKKSSILLSALDREGGRMSNEKRLRCLQASSKLYSAIAAQAPALLPLASRTKAATEAEFARYQKLEEAHAMQLHRLHLVATRGVLGHPNASDTLSAAFRYSAD